jgi:small subunit ribosomal protein S6e
MRIVISDPKTGKSYQIEIQKDQEAVIVGKRIGDSLDGGLIGAAGYSLEFTGGSDTSGFPMRMDIPGNRKMAVLLSEGIGFYTKRKGERRRKMIRGNIFSNDIAQVNATVVTAGATPLDQLFGKKEEEKKE